MTKKLICFFLTFAICTPLQSMRRVKILKLGGSIITDKSSHTGIAKEHVIDHVAKQLALYKNPVILTHGTGSFGHPLYHAYNLEHEYNPVGTMKVYKAEKQLNNVVMHSLHKYSIKAVCIDPMFNVLCEDGRITHMPIELIKQLILHGIVPVLFGSMVLDTKRKAYGLSSDQITTYLAEHLDIPEIGFGSSEYGVYDEHGDVIPEINPVNFETLREYIGGSEHVDTTGGMLGKVEEALEADGLTSFIFNAQEEHNVARFLHGEQVGTKVMS